MMKIELGVKGLDNILGNNGLESGVITNIYGIPGSGKTNMCLAASVAALRLGKKIIYIDSEGGFSSTRFEQMTKNYDIEMKNIFLLEPKDFTEQKSSIDKAYEISLKHDIGLIIVDSMVALYRLELTETKAFDANKELSRELAVLSKIAREKKIPILITTQVYSAFGSNEVEVSGGFLTKWWAKILMEVQKTENSNERLAILKKHMYMPEGLEAKFKITENGIEET